MTLNRTIFRPPEVAECDCGGELVREIVDGISAVYECEGCDRLLADLILGAEP